MDEANLSGLFFYDANTKFLTLDTSSFEHIYEFGDPSEDVKTCYALIQEALYCMVRNPKLFKRGEVEIVKDGASVGGSNEAQILDKEVEVEVIRVGASVEVLSEAAPILDKDVELEVVKAGPSVLVPSEVAQIFDGDVQKKIASSKKGTSNEIEEVEEESSGWKPSNHEYLELLRNPNLFKRKLERIFMIKTRQNISLSEGALRSRGASGLTIVRESDHITLIAYAVSKKVDADSLKDFITKKCTEGYFIKNFKPVEAMKLYEKANLEVKENLQQQYSKVRLNKRRIDGSEAPNKKRKMEGLSTRKRRFVAQETSRPEKRVKQTYELSAPSANSILPVPRPTSGSTPALGNGTPGTAAPPPPAGSTLPKVYKKTSGGRCYPPPSRSAGPRKSGSKPVFGPPPTSMDVTPGTAAPPPPAGSILPKVNKKTSGESGYPSPSCSAGPRKSGSKPVFGPPPTSMVVTPMDSLEEPINAIDDQMDETEEASISDLLTLDYDEEATIFTEDLNVAEYLLDS